MNYPKRYMSITEVSNLTGLPRTLLARYVHIDGFPAKKMVPEKSSKFMIDTEKFEGWYEKYGGRV